MLNHQLFVALLLLLSVCKVQEEKGMAFCDFASPHSEIRDGDVIRLSAVFVPNAHHGAFLKGNECPDRVMRVEYFSPEAFPAYFEAAYSGGGFAVRLESDLTVRVVPRLEGNTKSLALRILEVHAFRDVSAAGQDADRKKP